MGYPWNVGDQLRAVDLNNAFSNIVGGIGGGTGSFLIPVGTTAQRPNTGDLGHVRYNSTTGRYEFGTGGAWGNHVKLDGDTMTGALTVTGALTSANANFIQAGSVVGTNNVLRFSPTAAGGTPSIQVLGPDTNTGIAVSLKGTGTFTLPRVSLGTTQVLSGTAVAGQMALFAQSTISGTVTDPYRNINRILIQSDNVVTSGNAVQAFSVSHQFGGAAMTGGRIAFDVGLNQAAATANSASTFYQGAQITANAAFQEPGAVMTRTGSKGLLFALGITSQLYPGATNWSAIAGQEVDLVVAAQPYSVLGLSVVRLSGGFGTNYQAFEPALDTGFRIGNALPLAPWVNGYTITSPSGVFALDPAGYAFRIFDGQSYSTMPSVAAYGIHVQAVAFTQAAFLSQGAKIDGVGVGSFRGLNVGGWAATVTAAGMQLGPTNQIAMTVAVAAGGTGWNVNEKFTFGANGLGRVTTTGGGGAVTALTILQFPTSAAPPGNPVAATTAQIPGAGQSSGTGLTLNLTWSASDALTLGSAGGKHGFYGAAGVTKPTGVAVTIAAVHAALVSLNLIAP